LREKVKQFGLQINARAKPGKIRLGSKQRKCCFQQIKCTHATRKHQGLFKLFNQKKSAEPVPKVTLFGGGGSAAMQQFGAPTQSLTRQHNHQHVNTLADQQINTASTHQQINTSTDRHINTSTTSTQSSTHQRTCPTHQHINTQQI
jgi:hypothetical protein